MTLRAEAIRVFLRAMPFHPGFLVPHPDFAWVTQGQVVVTQPAGLGGRRQRTMTCDALHVTRIEVVERE